MTAATRMGVGGAVAARDLVAAALIVASAVVVWAARPASDPVRPPAAREAKAGAAWERLPEPARAAVARGLDARSGGYRIGAAAGGGFRAANARHGLAARFDRAGAHVRAGDLRVGLALAAVGRGRALRGVPAVEPRARANRVEYRHPTITEWYVNTRQGLEHGFTLARPPAGRRTGELALSLALSGAASVRVDRDGRGLTLSRAGASLRYAGLKVWDAGDRPLPAMLRPAGGGVVISIDDRRARYPLTVDPWLQTAKLTASDAEPNDHLGESVAVDADTIVVGADLDNVGPNADQGSVYVFERPAAGWADATESAKLTASDGAPADLLGRAVAVAGGTVVAGAQWQDAGATGNSGAVYVFDRPAGGWSDATETAKLTASDKAADDNLGVAVAVSGDTVVAGAQFDDGVQNDTGSVYVFERPPGGWASATESAKLTTSDAAAGDFVGASVAVSGGTIVAGATARDMGPNLAQGAAYVFERPVGGWASATETATLTASDGDTFDRLGSSVAVDGGTVAVGARFDDVGANADQGSVYVFERPVGGWASATETAKLIASDGAADDALGASVAVSGQTVAGGALSDAIGPNGAQGSVYVFERPSGGWASAPETAKLVAADGGAGDQLGASVAVSGGTIVAGAPIADLTGSAYVFARAAPDLAITATHDPDRFTAFEQGRFELRVSNVGGAATTSGAQVTDSVPAGLVVRGVAGNGWNCVWTGLLVTCTRSDGLAAGASYPPIVITVDVPGGTPSGLLTNTATVQNAEDGNPDNDGATDEVAVIGAAQGYDLEVTKTTNTTSAAPGDNVEYTITVANKGPGPSQEAIVEDRIPPDLTPVSVVSTVGICFVARVMLCQLPSLPSNQRAVIVIDTIVSDDAASGAVVNTVQLLPGTGDADGANNTASATVNLVVQPDLAIAKSHEPTQFTRGGSGSFTLDLSNAGNVPIASSVSVDDRLPDGLTPESASGTDWTCGINDQTVSCNRQSELAVGQHYPPITINVQVGGSAGDTLTNTATLTNADDTNTDNNSDDDQVDIAESYDVAVTKVADKSSAAPGEPVTFTMKVANQGPDTAPPVVVTDSLPAGLTATSLTTDAGSCELITLICGIESLGPAATATITLVAGVDAGIRDTTLTNSVAIQAGPADTDAGNDAAQASVAVVNQPDLTIDKTHAGEFVTGLPQSFRLAVANVGGGAVTAPAGVVDRLPAGLTPTAASGTGWDCGIAGQAVTCTREDDLAAGASYPEIAIAVLVGPDARGTLSNTAAVTSAGEGNTANNSDEDVVTVVRRYDVGIAKTATPITVLPGDTVRFTMTARNHGPGTSAAVTLTDTLPTGLMARQMTATAGSCDVSALRCELPPLAPPPAPDVTVTLVATVNTGTDNTTLRNVVRIDPGPDDSNAGNHESSASVVIGGRPDMTISKTHTPAKFVRGATGSYRLVARNSGTAGTNGTVTVRDDVPAGLTPTGAGGSGWSCDINGQIVTCTRNDPLGSGGSYAAVTVDVLIGTSAPGPITNTGAVSGGGEVNFANNFADDTVELVDGFDVSVTKAVTDAEILPGEQTTFVVNVVNGGPSASGPIHVDEALPAGLAFVSQTTSAGSCDAVTHDCDIPAREPGAGATITVVAQAPLTVLGSVETNAVSIDPGAGDTNEFNHDAQASVRILPVGRIATTKQLTRPLVRGATGEYRLVARNTGGAPTSGAVTISDPLPTGLTLASVTAPGWNCGGSSAVSCTRSDALAPGDAYPPIALTVAVSLTAPVTVTNAASATCTAPTLCEAIAARQDEPVDDIDVSLEKTVSPAPDVRAASNATWTLTVRNAGPSNANGVAVDDTLPAGVSLVSASASEGGTCAGPDCSWAAPLGPGQTRTVTIVTAAELPARDTDQVNEATVTAANIAADRRATNDSDGAAVHVVAPDLTIDKQSTSRLVRGADATWTLTVANAGSASSLGPTTVTDTLPAGLAYVSAVGAGWSCSSAMQLVTCTRAADLPAGHSFPAIELTARVALDAPATLTNSAAVAGPCAACEPASGNADQSPPQPVVSEVDLELVKTAAPDSILATQQTTFTLIATNRGPSIARDVVVEDPVPAGLAPVSGSSTLGTCSGGYTCALGDLQPGRSATITIRAEAENARPPAETVVTNTAEATSSTTELDTTDNTASADVEVRRTNDLLSLKTRTTEPPIAGAPATFEILVTNLGASDALGTKVTDPLPAPFAPGTLAGTFRRGVGVCGMSLSGTRLECDVPSIPAGGDALIAVTGTLRSDSAGQRLTNSACAASAADPEPGNNCSATDPMPIEARADIEAVKQGPATVTAGGEVTYDLLIRNNGPSDAPGARLVDTIPADTTFVDIDPDCPFVAADRQVVCDAGRLAPGGERKFELTVDTQLAQAERTLTNTLVASAGPPDPQPGNNTHQSATQVDPASDLAIVKTAPGAATAGQDVKYTLTTTNRGPSASPSAIVEDKLPRGMQLRSAITPQGNCSEAGGTVACNLGALAMGQSVVAEILVVPDRSLQNATVSNKASVRGPNADPEPENNTAATDVQVRAPLPQPLAPSGALVDPVLRKRAAARSVRRGRSIGYTIAVRNPGPETLRDVRVCDLLPAGLTYVARSASPRATVRAGQVCWTVASLGAGAGATFRLRARAAGGAGGTRLRNTATATGPGMVSKRARATVRLSGRRPGGERRPSG